MSMIRIPRKHLYKAITVTTTLALLTGCDSNASTKGATTTEETTAASTKPRRTTTTADESTTTAPAVTTTYSKPPAQPTADGTPYVGNLEDVTSWTMRVPTSWGPQKLTEPISTMGMTTAAIWEPWEKVYAPNPDTPHKGISTFNISVSVHFPGVDPALRKPDLTTKEMADHIISDSGKPRTAKIFAKNGREYFKITDEKEGWMMIGTPVKSTNGPPNFLTAEMTTPPEHFTKRLDEVEPYLLTLSLATPADAPTDKTAPNTGNTPPKVSPATDGKLHTTNDWSMRINPKWTKSDEFDNNWQTGLSANSSVGVGGNDGTPGTGKKWSPKEVMNEVVRSLQDAKATSIDAKLITINGKEVARITHSYTNSAEIQICTPLKDGFQCATFSTENAKFEKEVVEVEPYLLTLTPL
jgi:hypothetical protein